MSIHPIPGRVKAAAICLALAGAVIVFRSWLDARDDRTRMAATIASQNSIITAAEKREQDRAAQLADTLKQIADLKASVRTPQQVIREIPQFLPPLPQALETIAPPQPVQPIEKQAAPARTRETPAKPGEVAQPDVRVPSADLKTLFDFVQDCRACQAKLTAAEQQAADERAKTVALTRERDAAVKAAKGGSLWTRTVRTAKWIAVGFAAGYLAHSGGR